MTDGAGMFGIADNRGGNLGMADRMASPMGIRMDKVGAAGALFAAPLRGPVGRDVRDAEGWGLGPRLSDGRYCADAEVAEVEEIGATVDCGSGVFEGSTVTEQCAVCMASSYIMLNLGE